MAKQGAPSATPSSDARVAACCRAFAFLVEQFGFSQAEIEMVGHEQFVRFHRGESLVSIAWQDGERPVVALFYPPASLTDRPSSWTMRNGVVFCRRIPRLEVPYEPTEDPELFEKDLCARAAALLRIEGAWLASHAESGS
jgi:hypothetical protein